MRWRRWAILAGVLVLYTGLMAEIGAVLCMLVMERPAGEIFKMETLLFPFDGSGGWKIVLLPAMVLTVTQVMFLYPAINPAVLDKGRRKPLMLSLIAAGFAGSMLMAGLFFAVIELAAIVRGAAESATETWGNWIGMDVALWWPVVLASWMLWTPLVMLFARRTVSERWFGRVVAMLLAGTIVEVLVVVPVDIMVRRRSSCYCMTGTCFALCLSVCALLWLTGPGIVLALTSRRRRWWYDNHCMGCGYAKGPSPGQRCPECGHVWESQKAKQPNSQTVGGYPADQS